LIKPFDGEVLDELIISIVGHTFLLVGHGLEAWLRWGLASMVGVGVRKLTPTYAALITKVTVFKRFILDEPSAYLYRRFFFPSFYFILS
jgi:hypothetical protein